MPTFVLAVCGAFVLSLATVWSWRRLACRLECLDLPNERSSHVQVVPRSAGIAFAPVFLGAAWLLMADEPTLAAWLPVYIPAVLVLLTGLVDDFRSLGIAIRLLMQCLALLLALAWLPEVPVLQLPGGVLLSGPLMLVLLFACWLWFINLYNFMDGLDALAGSEAIFACLAIALFAGSGGAWALCQIALLLAACVAGFLLFNLPPATIFMGDAGSNFLGFILPALALTGISAGVMTPWTVLILFGVFIVDSSFTLLRRMLAGELWYHGHRSHAYQRAADAYAGHGTVVLAVSLVNACWLLPLAWLSTRVDGAGLVLLAVAWAPLLWFVAHLAAKASTGGPATRKPIA